MTRATLPFAARCAAAALAATWMACTTVDAAAQAAWSRPPTREAAIAALRGAAEAKEGESRRMLGSLVEGAAAPGGEALSLHESALEDGNRRAGQRLDLLRGQGAPTPVAASADARDDPLPDPGELVPYGKAGDPLSPGYHCHFVRGGPMWCHGGVD